MAGMIVPPASGFEKHSGAETKDQRLRRECIEWIATNRFVNGVTALDIMNHCFGVSLKLRANKS